jgi:hypothetical protein
LLISLASSSAPGSQRAFAHPEAEDLPSRRIDDMYSDNTTETKTCDTQLMMLLGTIECARKVVSPTTLLYLIDHTLYPSNNRPAGLRSLRGISGD